MSRFETSKFVRNPALMNQDILKSACDALEWEYEIINDSLRIIDVGTGKIAGNEYAIFVSGNDVTYNMYYLGNALEKVNQLQEMFFALNVEYVKKLVLSEFKKKGFTYKANEKFVTNDEEKVSFYLVGRSKDKGEIEPIGQIKITILKDGTVVSDSNYLPEDVNKLAHSAMDSIEIHFGSKRLMVKKEVPLKYRERIAKSTIINKIQNKLL